MATKGPSEAFVSVCERELGIDDFYDVYDKIESLSAHWKQIAISLHIKMDTISKIRANANGDTTACLQEVLECWLKKDYDYERCGSTTDYIPSTIIDFNLHRELFEIQEQFAKAIQETIKYYPKRYLPNLIEYITAHITTLLGPHENTPAKAQAVRKEFKEIKTVHDFFGLLQDKYTSWFKYGPIKKLVDENFMEYATETDFDYIASGSWLCYEQRLQDYFRRCITIANPALYGITDAPPGKPVIIAKVDRGDYNQNDLYFLRKAIPPELDRPDLKLYLCQVLPN
uniref:Death domain-containing protein n=1 Tax=Amphimedon queenslandica TaxID=400682 RepID=A0A1X7SWF8_AMPQE